MITFARRSLAAIPFVLLVSVTACGDDATEQTSWSGDWGSSSAGAAGSGGSSGDAGNGGDGGSGGDSSSAGAGGGNEQPATSLCLDARPINVVPPAGLQLRFRALDCDGNPVRQLTASDVSVINNEKGIPFGKGGEGDSVSGIGENSNVELYSVLVLDLSNSIFAGNAIDAVIDGALTFVNESVTKPKPGFKHRVAIIAFGRPDAITLEQNFTQDDALLRDKLEALRTSEPRGTTDLYDAYMKALSLVASTGGSGDSVTERFVVLLTDGTHEAGDEENLRQQALTAKHQSNATVYAIGIQGNYNACRLEELAGRGGEASTQSNGCRERDACLPGTSKPASCTQFFADANLSALSGVFEDVAARAAGIARSNYVVGICTPVSLGNPSLTLSVTVDGHQDEAKLDYSTSALNGDVNHCSAESIQKGKLLCNGAGTCEFVCEDKQCGTDQGVSCGTCGELQVCGTTQQCEPACLGMSCGSDRGVSCGSCSSNQYCSDANTCVAACQGMTCGTDHGVTCGSCSGNQYCSDANTCIAACQGMNCGTDHGVTCGSCGIGTGCSEEHQCVACTASGFLQDDQYSTGSGPYSVTVADFNGDGITDLATANYLSDNVSVLLGKGDGSFAPKTDFSTGSYPSSVTVADFNGDGITDLATANNNSNNVSVLLGKGDGSFAPKTDFSTGSYPNSVTAADFNGDGITDLATTNQNDNSASVLLGNGDGSFAPKTDFSTDSYPRSVTVADFNGDGKADLATANYYGANVSVLLGKGDGSFSPPNYFSTGAGPYSVTVADFNGDGKADLATANNNSKSVSVLLGKGDGSFFLKTNFSTGSGSYSVTVADFNGDGKADLATANASSSSLSVLLGKGDGSFSAKTDFSTGAFPTSVTVADFNGDGRTDLASVNYSDSNISVLLGKCLP